MTTLHPRPEAQPVTERLAQMRTRFRLEHLAVGTLACLTLLPAWAVLWTLVLGYWPDQPPTWLRWSLLLGALGSVLAAGAWLMVTGLFRRRNLAQVARQIEQSLPQLQNDLINSILLGQDDGQASEELVRAALVEARKRTGQVRLEESIRRTALKRWSIAGGVFALLAALLAILQPGPMRRGLLAAMPGTYVPHLNQLTLISLSPGDAELYAGQDWSIQARVENPDGLELEGSVLLEDGSQVPLDASQDHSLFTLPMGPAGKTTRYAVRIGDSRWPADRPWYTLTVWPEARIERLILRYEPPAYTHKRTPPREQEPAQGPIRCPIGTRVEVFLQTDRPVDSVLLDRKDHPLVTFSSSAGRIHRVRWKVTQDGQYRILLRNSDGEVFSQLPSATEAGYYSITAEPDSPPRADFVEPDRDISAAPGQTVTLRLTASDRYGLSELKLLGQIEYSRREKRPEFLFEKAFAVSGELQAQVSYPLTIPEDLPADGSLAIVYHAVAIDNRSLPEMDLGPQSHSSDRFRIHVQDPQKIAAEKLRAYEALRKRLLELLRMQARLRVDTGICRSKEQLEPIRSLGVTLLRGQKAVQTDLKDLVETFDFPPDFLPIKQVCASLAAGDALEALGQAQVLATLSSLEDKQASCDLLGATQERIIESLKTLLVILPSLADRRENQQTPEGADLPPETRQKLQDLKEQLKEFVDAQKKLIQAGDRLAKKPVDDFTSQDVEQLKQLIAAQDKWEKFLNEAFTDLSKMARQDFSNPSLLKELASVKTDVTMAKDALEKKAVEIATAIEDNGIENAQSLTANIEKWLPDEPDRAKWKMEDPADGHELTEQPELPDQLEDLVGDLLEEEEDLFEEMEDMTGNYNTSGDKGIGWDAMDGPISSMNAQGVTGNQLPNKNEMSGRSGEGRQGKSSGEYVEDKSVGKGGRRTPTRLTPDAYQKGQIDNQSKEPAGGATGGGKLSGAGAEGLEGPVPPEIKQQMQRLAGRQAELIHRAEKHRASYKPNDYRNFELGKTIQTLRRLHQDLKNNRYGNALRSKQQVLGQLRQTSLLLTGQVHVAEDTSQSMPKYLREMSTGTDPDPSDPAEYRKALKEYYQRLSEIQQ